MPGRNPKNHLSNTSVVRPLRKIWASPVFTARRKAQSPRGKAIEYGMANYPQTVNILQRFAGPAMHPKHTDQDVADIIAAVRKVYPQVT